MNINSVKLIYFSPTGTTRKVLAGIAQGIQIDAIEHIDLTPSRIEKSEYSIMADELAIIGVPVYGGRVPPGAAQRLQTFKARDTPAILIVVYGNREFEDALIELKDLSLDAGFKPFAGGAFIGEHSFSSDAKPIARGRPDEKDLKKAREYGAKILNKISNIDALEEMLPFAVPGNSPYKEQRKRSGISPITQEDICTLCETCGSVCPTAAITINDKVMTDASECILCCACVKNCPSGARIMDNPDIQQMTERLYKRCQVRKEPEIFL